MGETTTPTVRPKQLHKGRYKNIVDGSFTRFDPIIMSLHSSHIVSVGPNDVQVSAEESDLG
jgi:hypothetical protein